MMRIHMSDIYYRLVILSVGNSGCKWWVRISVHFTMQHMKLYLLIGEIVSGSSISATEANRTAVCPYIEAHGI